jgi:tetratricopeptide (TPR) repeat protein
VEGLSIDKFNKELNCLLASLYENEKDYKRAEIVYKDLIILHPMDTELYLKLGFVIVIQSKYEIAYEIYKKLHDLDPHNTEAMNMLAHITHEI